MSHPTNVTVTKGHFRFPDLCALCLSDHPSAIKPVTSDYGKFSGYFGFFITRKHLVMQIPFCIACAGKEHRIQKYASALTILGMLVGVGVSIHFDLGNLAWLLGVVFCAPGIFLSELVGKPVRIGRYDDNAVEFSFKSPAYAERFRTLNQSR
jgi:hypothetical protein